MSNQPFFWLNPESVKFLHDGYIAPDVDPIDRLKEIAREAKTYLLAANPDSISDPIVANFEEKFLDYASRGWISLSSPVWSNYGSAYRTLPISCFGSYVDDSVYGILSTQAEVGTMCKNGGGTSGYFGALRKRGEKISTGGEASGPVHYMQAFDSVANIISQGSTRRGHFAAYLDIEHPDIEEFMLIRSKGNPIQDMSFGVCISDEWMQAAKDGDKDKRQIWSSIIKKKFESGYPYILWSDTVNQNKPQVYIDLEMLIHASNMCTEIMLPSGVDFSFVCCLASLNLLYYQDWKDTDLVQVMIYFLDTVLTDFINKAKNIPFMERSVKFAEEHRALGLGVLGYHSYLQSNMIPFASMEAQYWNKEVFKLIDERSLAATKTLAELYGEPVILKGYGQRNTTRIAIAPTTSSSYILGQVSPGIEPWLNNYFIEDNAKGMFVYKNKNLERILVEKGRNTKDVWDSILHNDGSVQHLDFLSDHEKEVFKSFIEISQKEIVVQAAQRQRYIDQAQSINLMIHPKANKKEVNELYFFAWEAGLKSLYYQRGVNVSQELANNLLNCAACEA
jgi:ribonucleoside-diphosphate reductase alpha chain